MLDVLLDPDRRAEAARDQVRLERTFGHRLVKDPAMVNYVRGRAAEQNVLSALQSDEFSCDQSLLLKRLAEAYKAQGRFAEAAGVAVNQQSARHYGEVAEAMASLDARRCGCPTIVTLRHPNDAKGVRIRTLREIERVWTESGRVLIMRCNQCRVLSAIHG